MGAIAAEMLTGDSLFTSENEQDTLVKMQQTLGPLPETLVAGFKARNITPTIVTQDASKSLASLCGSGDGEGRGELIGTAIQFVEDVLNMDAASRISCGKCISHALFADMQ